MESIVKILLEAPVANFLIFAAVVFFLFAVGLNVRGKVEPDSRGRLWSVILGILLLFVGIGMHYWGSPHRKP